MRLVIAQLMELAPTEKLMYASDAHYIPELFYVGAKWGRTVRRISTSTCALP